MDTSGEPFSGARAVADGRLCRYRLRHHRRLYPDTYVSRDVDVDASVRARAVWIWCRGRGVLAGRSAAALLGTKWIDPSAPGALAWTPHRSPPPGIELYRERIPDDEMLERDGPRLTTAARTAFDLGRRLPLDEAVEMVDALYQATGLTRAALTAFTAAHSRARGIVQLRQVITLSDEGAESLWETRTRLAIVRDGLPRPESQVQVRDADGRWIGRVDLCWEKWRVIVEYDGDHHFDPEQRNRDVERWNALEAAGWRVIRVKARQLMRGRATLLRQIRAVLAEAGAPVTAR
ncbi:endonuclease domain-containing protein [Rhodococcus sp. NPDC058532]|uniref:endonuclease domain-containing protein n=1 Tax=Rhodococcus sp. NPDC058532 TaxID=3346540 RepID=UPI00365FD206